MRNPFPPCLRRVVARNAFIGSINLAVVVAALLPASEAVLPWVDGLTKAAIGFLFFLYGVRLTPKDAVAGLKSWRVHTTILVFTFVVFPLLGALLWFVPTVMLAPQLYPGVLFMCLVPSTVQASISFTATSGGNVPAAITSASLSNLVGIFVTPLLAVALMTTSGRMPVHGSAVAGLCEQLLIPFVLGQLLRPLVGEWVRRNGAWLRFAGRESIVLVVYSSFSVGTHEGMWHLVTGFALLQLVAMSITLVTLMLWLTAVVAVRLGFETSDVRAIQFCSTKKALVTGLPMASVLFAGQTVGLLVLPLMIFHQVQLVMCSWLSHRYAALRRRATA